MNAQQVRDKLYRLKVRDLQAAVRAEDWPLVACVASELDGYVIRYYRDSAQPNTTQPKGSTTA